MTENTEFPAFTDAPGEEESRKLTILGRELYSVDTEIQALELKLEERKARKKEIQMRELPEYFRSINQDKLGLPEFDVDLVLEPFYHANIKAEWPDEQRQKAFDYLEARGDGDLIKTVLELQFGRKELWKVRWLLAHIKLLADEVNKYNEPQLTLPEPYIRMGVMWNTLTAHVRSVIEKGEQLDLEILGAEVGQIVKIKPRKKK